MMSFVRLLLFSIFLISLGLVVPGFFLFYNAFEQDLVNTRKEAIETIHKETMEMESSVEKRFELIRSSIEEMFADDSVLTELQIRESWSQINAEILKNWFREEILELVRLGKIPAPVEIYPMRIDDEKLLSFSQAWPLMVEKHGHVKTSPLIIRDGNILIPKKELERLSLQEKCQTHAGLSTSLYTEVSPQYFRFGLDNFTRLPASLPLVWLEDEKYTWRRIPMNWIGQYVYRTQNRFCRINHSFIGFMSALFPAALNLRAKFFTARGGNSATSWMAVWYPKDFLTENEKLGEEVGIFPDLVVSLSMHNQSAFFAVLDEHLRKIQNQKTQDRFSDFWVRIPQEKGFPVISSTKSLLSFEEIYQKSKFFNSAGEIQKSNLMLQESPFLRFEMQKNNNTYWGILKTSRTLSSIQILAVASASRFLLPLKIRWGALFFLFLSAMVVFFLLGRRMKKFLGIQFHSCLSFILKGDGFSPANSQTISHSPESQPTAKVTKNHDFFRSEAKNELEKFCETIAVFNREILVKMQQSEMKTKLRKILNTPQKDFSWYAEEFSRCAGEFSRNLRFGINVPSKHQIALHLDPAICTWLNTRLSLSVPVFISFENSVQSEPLLGLLLDSIQELFEKAKLEDEDQLQKIRQNEEEIAKNIMSGVEKELSFEGQFLRLDLCVFLSHPAFFAEFHLDHPQKENQALFIFCATKTFQSYDLIPLNSLKALASNQDLLWMSPSEVLFTLLHHKTGAENIQDFYFFILRISDQNLSFAFHNCEPKPFIQECKGSYPIISTGEFVDCPSEIYDFSPKEFVVHSSEVSIFSMKISALRVQ